MAADHRASSMSVPDYRGRIGLALRTALTFRRRCLSRRTLAESGGRPGEPVLARGSGIGFRSGGAGLPLIVLPMLNIAAASTISLDAELNR